MQVRGFFSTLKFPIVVFIIHLFLFYFNFYLIFPWLDIPMHFLGGFSIALSYTSFLFNMHVKKLAHLRKDLFFLFVISFVALTAMLWEFLEFGLDISLNLNSQMGLVDTILDMFLGLAGGVTYIFLIKNRKAVQGQFI